ncbi:alpha/beta hydrolase [Actinosynnema sp. NPDC020468]|uniref:alpha/beta fold hydrolase n=1 Tax=Actinosynnema sp. NPDC020468 TaxID=3154488 RepID=UPI0033DB6595
MSRPLLVLVHGMEDGPGCWQPLVEQLGDRWWTIAPALPWRAGGDYRWRATGTPGALLAAELATVLSTVDERPVALVGHSFGANAVLELAARASAPAAALVLLSPTYRPPDLELTWATFDRSRAAFDRQIADGVATRLGRRLATLDADVAAAMAAKAADRAGPAGFLAAYDQFAASADLPLRAVPMPALVLSGRGDPSLGRTRAAALAAAMPTARVVVEDHFDHFCHVRQAADVAARITEFLDTTGSHR